MAAPVEDVSKLQGQVVFDQWGQKIGEVKQIYAVDEGVPMWVTVEVSPGVAGSKTVFVPIARLKEEDEQLRVPYSVQHIEKAPDFDAGEELSQEEDRQLRDYYAIDHADQELRSDNRTYADRVVEGGGQPRETDSSEVKTTGGSVQDDPEDSGEDEESEGREQDRNGEGEDRGGEERAGEGEQEGDKED